MSYLYGDSTPSKLEGNYIELLRDAVEFCVQVLAADQRITEGREKARSLEQATATEYERLQTLGGLVSKSFEGTNLGAAESAAARCAAAILHSAGDLVRAEAVAMRTALDAEIGKREVQAGQEREGCVRALETLIVKHDLPETSVDVHVATSGGRYAGRARLRTGFGLDALLDLEIPADNLFDRVFRVDRLMERLDVSAPEIGGWLHKEMKKRTQHLEKHHVVDFSMGTSSGLIKLRLNPDGTGPGFDVLISREAPRVRLARADQQESGDPPFEVDDEDAKKLLALQGKLAAAALELTKHRRRLVEAKIDGEAMRTHAKQTVLAERLIAKMAPVVQEIAWRSQSPNELVLRRLLSGDRREEIFLSKEELKRKVAPLQESNRALFDPLWVTSAPAAPGKGAGGDAHGHAGNTPHTQTVRQRPHTPAIGTPSLGSAPQVVRGSGDASKPTEASGDVLRRTLIGTTVDAAVQAAAASASSSTPPPTPASSSSTPPPTPASSSSSSPPSPPSSSPSVVQAGVIAVETVSKTPLANPSHVDTLRKEAAGTIDAKQSGPVGKN